MFRRLIDHFQRRVARIPPLAFLLLALLLTATATYYSYSTLQLKRVTSTEQVAVRLVNKIQDRLASYETTLLATRSFLLASKRHEPGEFARFIAGLDIPQHYPSLFSVGFAALAPDGSLKVRFVEPGDPQRARLLGLDLKSVPSHARSLELARDSGTAYLAKSTPLVSEPGKGAPYILFLPVYNKAMAGGTAEERRAGLIGYVFATFRAGELLSRLSAASFRGIEIEVFDGDPTDEGARIFHAPGAGRQVNTTQWTEPLTGNSWTVAVHASPAALGERGVPEFWLVLGAGLGISFIIYFFSLMAARYANSLEQNRSLLSLVTNSVPSLIAYVDRRHLYRYANTTYREWFGIEPESLHGQSVAGFMGPRYEKFFRPLIDRALNGERLEFEYSIERAGQVRALRSQYIPDFTSKDRVAGFVALVSDVTEQKAFQDRLRDERRISELVIEVGLSLQAELDPGKLILRMTEAATEVTGAEGGAFFHNVKDERGENHVQITVAGALKERMQAKIPQDARELMGLAFKADRIVRLDDVQGRSEFGALADLGIRSYLAVPVISRSGELLGGLTFVHTRAKAFTERAEKLVAGIAAQAAVALDNAQLYSESQTVNRVKDEFLATLSHELRTPMNVILGYSELLKDEDLPQSIKDQVDAIYRNARAQNQLIADLLDISAIITGKLVFQPMRLSSLDVANAAVSSIRFAAESKGVHLETRFDGQGCTIYADPTRVQQIIWNLLSNAVKFTPSGGTVSVSLRAENGKCVIEVADTGIGIDPEFLPYVFDRFRQEDSGRSRRFGGLGLGLSIVRQLVELHGGTIGVHSGGKNQGAVFTVSLPQHA